MSMKEDGGRAREVNEVEVLLGFLLGGVCAVGLGIAWGLLNLVGSEDLRDVMAVKDGVESWTRISYEENGRKKLYFIMH
jgi:hypothetical protein